MAIQHYDWIEHHASYAPDSLAQQDLHSRRSFTYSQMHRRVEALAGFLQREAGVQPGDRIATLCHNSTDNNEIIFAAPRVGAIHLPLNWRLAVPELEFILNDAEPRVLFYSAEFSEQAAELKRLCKIPVTLLKRDGPDSDYEQAITAGIAPSQRHRPSLDDVWVLMYTSGTT
jgi:fatty-acyl-CoA synthase